MTGASGPAGYRFDPTILREYDIRGVVGETLSAADARALGRGFGTLLRRAGGTKSGDVPRKLLDVLRSSALGRDATTELYEDLAKKPTTGICPGRGSRCRSATEAPSGWIHPEDPTRTRRSGSAGGDDQRTINNYPERHNADAKPFA
jgi:hypothetical protein